MNYLFSQSLRVEMNSYTIINRYPNTSMSPLKFSKLWKILADHYQCIQLWKEHNLLASSIKCSPENCSNTLTWARRTSLRDGYEWRYIEGQWLFGSICCQTKACSLWWAKWWRHPWTCVMSDMSKAYDCLNNEGYTHLTVNQSLNFVHLDTGAHTQRKYENTCWGV